MVTITPLSGYKNVTVFTFENSVTASDPVVNWGDSSFSYSNSATHVYSDIGIYNGYGGPCNATSAFSLSVYTGEFFLDQISVTSDATSSLVSCPYTFNINLSSKNEVNTILLYSSGSQSIPYQSDRNFWSHLNPEWEFLYNDSQISEITMSGTPVYSGTNILGYTATSAIQYKDDMPGNVVLFFTVQKDESDLPINSRVYSALTHTICAVNPDKLFITADGINPLNSIQWADKNVPYVISVGSSQISCTKILHYINGSIQNIAFNSQCYGVSSEQIIYNVFDINSYDQNCMPTGGYGLSSFYFPSSALPSIEISNDLEECNFNYDKVEFLKSRKTPTNTTLSAFGYFNYCGNYFTLSGVSDAFQILADENRHEFYRKGEDYTVYDILKHSLPFELDQYPRFDTYLSAVAGPGDSLGKAYDKISNFNLDHSDIDLCNYTSLINKGQEFDYEIDDFGLEFPEELKRIFNFATVPLQKLIGTRCVCNMNFSNCNGCIGTNICNICDYDKRSNLGDKIEITDYITVGETILYKESGGEFYEFLYVQPQDTDSYQLSSLSAEPIYSKGIQNFCFYRWDKTPQNNPVQSLVNYKDERNMLNPTLSSASDWYSDNGIIEEMFNHILTKNLIGTVSAVASMDLDLSLKLWFKAGVSVGNLPSAYTEFSGLTNPNKIENKDYLWSIVDGPENYVLALNKNTAALAGKWTITGMSGQVDIEDCTSCVVDGVPYLFLGDTGDNGSSRSTINIYRVVEPTITGSNGTISTYTKIVCQFPAGNMPSHKDVETIMADPDTGDIYFVTKRISPVKLYRLPFALTYTGTQTLEFVTNLTNDASFNTISTTRSNNNGYATGGNISPNGEEIIIRNYSKLFVWKRNKTTETIGQCLARVYDEDLIHSYVGGGGSNSQTSPPKCLHPNQEPQGESVSFDYTGYDLYTCSEALPDEGSSSTAYPLFKYERLYKQPIVVELQNGLNSYTGCVDTYLDSNNPTTSYNNAVSLAIDNDYSVYPTISRSRQTLIKYDLSSIPGYATITGAYLTVYINTEGRMIGIHQMLASWTGDSTYNSFGSGVQLNDVQAKSSPEVTIGFPTNLITTTAPVSSTKGIDSYVGFIRINLNVDLVQKWRTGEYANEGLLFVHPIDESTGDGLQIDSSESTTQSRKPKLTISYIL